LRISGLYFNPIHTVLKIRTKIAKKILCGEADTVKASESDLFNEKSARFGEDAKVVRKHKLKLTLLTPEEKDEAVEKYQSGLSQAEIADMLGCHHSTISRLLKQRGVEVRQTKAEAGRNFLSNPRIL